MNLDELPDLKKRYVCGFLFVEHEVALIEKLAPAWQRGLLNGIGGKIEPCESSVDAMVREFREEAGLATQPEDWQHMLTLVNHQVGYGLDFYQTRRETKDGVHSVEDEQVGWYRWDLLPDNVIHNIRWLVPLALDTVTKPLFIEDFGDY